MQGSGHIGHVTSPFSKNFLYFKRDNHPGPSLRLFIGEGGGEEEDLKFTSQISVLANSLGNK